MTRGIRNHNPGNIDYNAATRWAGQLMHNPAIESRFCRFESPVFGIRALCKLLLTYQKKYGIDTVAGIILRWAPSIENNTLAYIDSVAKSCGVKDTQSIIVADYLDPLAKAIIQHENGSQPYSDETIRSAIHMATGGK